MQKNVTPSFHMVNQEEDKIIHVQGAEKTHVTLGGCAGWKWESLPNVT